MCPLRSIRIDRILAASTPGLAELTHDQMRGHIAAGDAITLSKFITDFVKYDGSWSIVDRPGWIQIDDANLSTKLNNRSRWANGTL